VRTIRCAAPDCDREFIPKMPHAKYCSDRCRWRDAKRKTYESRLKAGLCPQCGGQMDREESYCTKCQTYYHNRYIKRRKNHDKSN